MAPQEKLTYDEIHNLLWDTEKKDPVPIDKVTIAEYKLSGLCITCGVLSSRGISRKCLQCMSLVEFNEILSEMGR